MHDGWDSKDHDCLGVSIQFVDPITTQLVTLAVGIKRVQDKSAISISDKIMLILR